MEHVIQVDNVSKSYPQVGGLGLFKREKTILENVSFTIDRGECLGLLGESGSGKSTLSRLILGIEKPNCGQIRFNNAPVLKPSVRKNRMSVVFQDYRSSLNPNREVSASIAEPLLLSGCRQAQLNGEVKRLLELVGLPQALATRFPHQLSGGQIQRVCIARAIATHPEFILLDEAISSLDISAQVQILDLLAELKTALNMTYFFVSHDIQAIAYLCNRVLFLKDGHIVEESSIDKLSWVENDYAKKLLSAVIAF